MFAHFLWFFVHLIFLIAFLLFAFQLSCGSFEFIFFIIIIIIFEFVNVIISSTYIVHFFNRIRRCSRMGLKERYTVIKLCPPSDRQKHTCQYKTHHHK